MCVPKYLSRLMAVSLQLLVSAAALGQSVFQGTASSNAVLHSLDARQSTAWSQNPSPTVQAEVGDHYDAFAQHETGERDTSPALGQSLPPLPPTSMDPGTLRYSPSPPSSTAGTKVGVTSRLRGLGSWWPFRPRTTVQKMDSHRRSSTGQSLRTSPQQPAPGNVGRGSFRSRAAGAEESSTIARQSHTNEFASKSTTFARFE
jgi:hypothetical protein